MSSTLITTPLKNTDSTKVELRMVGSPLFKDHHPPHSFGVLSPIDTAFDEFPNPNCQRIIPGDNYQNTPSWTFLPRQWLFFEIVSIPNAQSCRQYEQPIISNSGPHPHIRTEWAIYETTLTTKDPRRAGQKD